MGCEIVVAGGSAEARRRIRTLFENRDRIFSRFRPDSELNRVNAARGGIVRLSSLFAATLRAALEAAEATEGLVDPTLGATIEAAGYTSDFADLAPDLRPAGPASPGSWGSLRLAGRLLFLPAHVRRGLARRAGALWAVSSRTTVQNSSTTPGGGSLAGAVACT